MGYEGFVMIIRIGVLGGAGRGKAETGGSGVFVGVSGKFSVA